MPEIEPKKEFVPIYLVIKTREEFNFLRGLTNGDPIMTKQDCLSYDLTINDEFKNVLNDYYDAQLKGN